jgi:hypothetical protein
MIPLVDGTIFITQLKHASLSSTSHSTPPSTCAKETDFKKQEGSLYEIETPFSLLPILSAPFTSLSNDTLHTLFDKEKGNPFTHKMSLILPHRYRTIKTLPIPEDPCM